MANPFPHTPQDGDTFMLGTVEYTYSAALNRWTKSGGGPSGSGGGTLIGQIIIWPSATPPPGYALCDGSSFDTLQNPELFNILGTDALPDLRGQFVRGYDPSGANVLSQHDWTTGMPKQGLTGTTSSRGAHSHTTTFHAKNTDANWMGRGEILVSDNMQTHINNRSKRTNTTGDHSHTVIINGGGDAETAPDHVILAYVIATDAILTPPQPTQPPLPQPPTPQPPTPAPIVATPSVNAGTLELTITGGPSSVDNTLSMPIFNDGIVNYDLSAVTASYTTGATANVVASAIQQALDGQSAQGATISASLTISGGGDAVVQIQVDGGLLPILGVSQHITGTNEQVTPNGTPTVPPVSTAPPNAAEITFDHASLSDAPATVQDWRTDPDARLCAVFHPSTQLGVIMLRTDTRVVGGSLQAGGTQFLAAQSGEGIGSVSLLNGTALIEATATTGGTAPLRTAVQNWGGPSVTDAEILGNFQYCYYAQTTLQSSPSTGGVVFATLHRGPTMTDTARLEIVP